MVLPRLMVGACRHPVRRHSASPGAVKGHVKIAVILLCRMDITLPLESPRLGSNYI